LLGYFDGLDEAPRQHVDTARQAVLGREFEDVFFHRLG